MADDPRTEGIVTKKNLVWIAFGILLIVFAVLQFIPPPHAPGPGAPPPQQPAANRD
jgi:hypothetical protein